MLSCDTDLTLVPTVVVFVHYYCLYQCYQDTGVDLDVKGLKHVSSLMDSAEEWMARVREVLYSCTYTYTMYTY
jgi:hypothetical protein